MAKKKTAEREDIRAVVARAELALLVQMAKRTGLSTDVLLGLQPMPDTISRGRLATEERRACQLVRLVGCTIEALEGYDSDDGHNELVLAGIVAELRRIEGQYNSELGAAHSAVAAAEG